MNKNILGAAGLLTVGLVAGSAFAITGANAADSESVNATASTSTSTTAPTFTPGDKDDANRPDVFSTTSIKPGESLVTGSDATKLTDAALAKYAGATVIRVENDSDGDKYEVHLKLTDGSVVTVTFDEDFNVTGDHEGFADPAKGGPQGPHDDNDSEDLDD